MLVTGLGKATGAALSISMCGITPSDQDVTTDMALNGRENVPPVAARTVQPRNGIVPRHRMRHVKALLVQWCREWFLRMAAVSAVLAELAPLPVQGVPV